MGGCFRNGGDDAAVAGAVPSAGGSESDRNVFQPLGRKAPKASWNGVFQTGVAEEERQEGIPPLLRLRR